MTKRILFLFPEEGEEGKEEETTETEGDKTEESE